MKQPRENTTHGQADHARKVFRADAGSGNDWVIDIDPANGDFKIEKRNSSDVRIDAAGSIECKLSDLEGVNKQAKFRAVDICVEDVVMTTYILCTEPEAAA